MPRPSLRMSDELYALVEEIRVRFELEGWTNAARLCLKAGAQALASPTSRRCLEDASVMSPPTSRRCLEDASEMSRHHGDAFEMPSRCLEDASVMSSSTSTVLTTSTSTAGEGEAFAEADLLSIVESPLGDIDQHHRGVAGTLLSSKKAATWKQARQIRIALGMIKRAKSLEPPNPGGHPPPPIVQTADPIPAVKALLDAKCKG